MLPDYAQEIKPELFQLLVYPNPSDSKLNVKILNRPHSGELRVELFDVMDRLTLRRNQTISDDFTLDLPTIQPGIYFLKVSGFNGTKVVKLVIRQ